MASVVVINEDRDLLATLCDVLEDDGHRAVGFDSPIEALGYLRTSAAPSLILLDVATPLMTAARFRHEQMMDPRLAAIPLVGLSGGYSADPGADGVTEILAKPVSLVDLLRAVARVADDSRAA